MTARSDPAIFKIAPENALEARIVQLERQLARERQTRIEAEAIAERGLREAYLGHVRIKLLSTIAGAANSSIDPMETLRFTIAEVCAALGYVFANVLLCEGSATDRRLEACGIWYARNPDEMFSFAEKSRRLIAWPCASAPGRLLITKQSVWTRDLQQVVGFGRGEAAQQVHLRSSVSVPVPTLVRLLPVMMPAKVESVFFAPTVQAVADKTALVEPESAPRLVDPVNE
jgi:hypothetical protein